MRFSGDKDADEDEKCVRDDLVERSVKNQQGSERADDRRLI